MIDQRLHQEVQLFWRMLARDHEPKVTFFRSAGIFGQGRKNAGCQQPTIQGGRLMTVLRRHEEDGAGIVGQPQPTASQAVFGLRGILLQPQPKATVPFHDVEGR